MKATSIITLILLALACGKTEDGLTELSADELAALQERAKAKCFKTTQSHFDSFKAQSTKDFYSNTAYDRGATWTHSFKSGSDERYKHTITVWKATTTDVYFLIAISDPAGYQFVKVPKATNDAMITKLQTDHCKGLEELDLKMSSTGGTFTEISSVTQSTIKKETTSTHTYVLDLLAYMSIYKETRKTQDYDADDVATGTATTLTGTLTDHNYPEDTPEFTTYTSYGNRLFCIVDPKYTVEGSEASASYPYALSCEAEAAAPFDVTELNGPF